MNTPLYNKIGKSYDIARKADQNLTAILIEKLAPRKDGRYIDIACGSGNYTSAIFNHNIYMEGVDISEIMLEKARSKHPTLVWHKGNAENLPFTSKSFDGATCILATHHFSDKQAAFNEAYRIINQGFLVLFTSTPEQMHSYWLSHYFPNLINESSKAMQSFADLEKDLMLAGFTDIVKQPFFVTNTLEDFFLQSGKCRPYIYLDKNVRDGISSFQMATDLLEIENGLELLRDDLKTGKINKIIKNYENDKGDYIFVSCRK